MRRARWTCRVVASIALIGSVAALAPVQSWGQALSPWALAASPQSTTPALPRPPVQKPTEPGVWHHFGEGQKVRSAEPRQSGVWRHFGDGVAAPPSVQESPARRNVVQGRAGEMEQLMYELVNRDRADPANRAETNGRALPLRWNERLAAVARAHSLDMMNQGYFAHQDPQGRSVATRVEAAGMAWQAVGENIAVYDSVHGAQTAFMNEPRFAKNHRANILSSDFTEVGIGIVQVPDGSLFITQDFYTER